ncbi:hypothetical protein HK405_015814 [Cladochytrium tenue]|nr:hypothetical protein HK405_015814 [Cladochytrium tenue]
MVIETLVQCGYSLPNLDALDDGVPLHSDGRRSAAGGRDDGAVDDGAASASASAILEDSRRLEKRLLQAADGDGLRLVGLSSDAAEWEHDLIKLLFYPGLTATTRSPGGPGRSGGRLVSFARSEEGASLVAGEELLARLPPRATLTAGAADARLRCIQVDLRRHGLDRYGIVWSMAMPLVTRGINLLYLSTASAAHVLVDENDLDLTLQTLAISSGPEEDD